MQAARRRRLVADDGSPPLCPCCNPPSSLIRGDLTEIGSLLAQLGPETRAQAWRPALWALREAGTPVLSGLLTATPNRDRRAALAKLVEAVAVFGNAVEAAPHAGVLDDLHTAFTRLIVDIGAHLDDIG